MTNIHLKQFARTDGLLRGTALLSNLASTVTIALLPGFGANGLLFSNFVQMSITGVLEIPTGWIADQYGWARSVQIALLLKFVVTVVFVGAVIAATHSKSDLAWALIAIEAVIDAFAGSFLSGAYQAAYLKWYEVKLKGDGIHLDTAPPLFLASFAYAAPVRFIIPIAVTILLVFVNALNLEMPALRGSFIPILSLSIVLILRGILLVRMNYQLKDQLKTRRPKTAMASTGTIFIKGLAREVKKSRHLVFIYIFSITATTAATFQFLGQAFQTLSLITESGSAWLNSVIFGVIFYIAETLISMKLFPKLKFVAEAFNPKLTAYTAIISLLTGTILLCPLPLLAKLFLLSGYATISLVTAGAIQRHLQSNLNHFVTQEYRATWLSLCRCAGLLAFGLISGIIILFKLGDIAAALFCIMTAVAAFLFGTKSILEIYSTEKLKTARPFRAVLGRFIAIVAISCAFSVFVFDLGTYVRSTSLSRNQQETAISHLVETAIKEPLTQGSFLEAVRRLQRMMADGIFRCGRLKVWDLEQDLCPEKGINGLTSSVILPIYLGTGDGPSIGTIALIFDRSALWIDVILRSLQVVMLLIVCAISLIFALKRLANKTVSELDSVIALATSEQATSPHLLENIEIAEFRALAMQLQKNWKERELNSRQLTIAALAQQVAHDIRSPLAALTVAERYLSALPEDTRVMIRSAITRINDIANGLLRKSPPSNTLNERQLDADSLSINLLPALIDSLVTEKRMHYRSRLGAKIEYNIGYEDYGIFSQIQPSEFKRILSNLINNSMEALGDTGQILVSMKGSPAEVTLQVSDNGHGIAPEILPKLMRRGETHGKTGGSGLGLFHAHNQVGFWGGRLEISSTLGQGTQITITLPRAPAPHWFLPKLSLQPNCTVVVIDDDESIHQIWQGRFDKIKLESGTVKIKHFSTAQEIQSWVTQKFDAGYSPGSNTVFLFDYELLGQDTNGLALIEKLGLAQQSILVTSRFEDQIIRATCERLGVKLIPKGMAGFIPIEF